MQKENLIMVCGLEINYNNAIHIGCDKFVVTGKNEVKRARIDVVSGLVWEAFPFHILRLAMENPFASWMVVRA